MAGGNLENVDGNGRNSKPKALLLRWAWEVGQPIIS